MSIKNFFDGGKQVSDNAGLPLNGGKCYFYEPTTTTLKTTYTTSALSVANANPVVLDSAGRANIWLSGNYRVIVKDSTEATTIYDEDNISPETTSALTAITADTTLALADRAEFIQASGTITITLTSAATLGAGWYVYIRNNGSNNITITGANTGNTFNGTTFASATYTLYTGVSVFVVVNAAATGFITYGSVEAGGANKFTGTLTMSGKSILDANASVAAAAATSDIWSAGNYVTLTGGAVTFTDFADAPQAGAEVELYCNAAHVFTDNANLEMDGDANFTAEAGDRVLVRAKSTTVFTGHPRRKTGSAVRGVLQVVQGEYSTSTAINSVPYLDTGLSKAITISAGSQVLVTVNQQVRLVGTNPSGAGCNLRIVRDTTTIKTFAGAASVRALEIGASTGGDVRLSAYIAVSYLDTAPGGAGTYTYKTQASTNAAYNFQDDSITSVITLMEIRA